MKIVMKAVMEKEMKMKLYEFTCQSIMKGKVSLYSL